jgi:hypothetical protein
MLCAFDHSATSPKLAGATPSARAAHYSEAQSPFKADRRLLRRETAARLSTAPGDNLPMAAALFDR